MRRLLFYFVFVLLSFHAAINAQKPDLDSEWCSWSDIRANVVAVSGWWESFGGSKTSSGHTVPESNNEAAGFFYYLNLNMTFDTRSSNWAAIFKTMAKNSSELSHIGGTMLATHDGWYLYGGITRDTAPPSVDTVLGFTPYLRESSTGPILPGFVNKTLDTSMTNQISYGASVSAPSEKLGFYFSGIHAPGWGRIYDDGSANRTADTLVIANMTIADDVEWTNNSLPDYIPGRADAELVWVPVSEEGILVAIGSVVNPVESFRSLNRSQEDESKKSSPEFMKTISIYDVQSQQWYLQETTGAIPSQRTKFCSVVASAADNSSHNIYIYGGNDGLSKNSRPFEEVYVLSIPSFTWVEVYSGSEKYGRLGHKCFKTHPDQMFAIGGRKVSTPDCLNGGMIRIFNLNTLQFQDIYSPTEWSEYAVPSVITTQIGGDSKGGATKTAPESWTNSSLADIFTTKYTKALQTWDPYMAGNGNSSQSDGFPRWAGAVIGVVVGLLVISILVGLWLLRRRRKARATGETVTTELDGASKPRPELGSEQVHEMDIRGGTRVELPTTYNDQPNTIKRFELPGDDAIADRDENHESKKTSVSDENRD